jgi:hypothetical protein
VDPKDREGNAINLLLTEHQAVRDDMRGANSWFATLFGVAAVLLAGVGGLLLDATRFESSAWVYAALPAIPLIVAAYVVLQAVGVTIRSYYARAIERELFRLGVSLHESSQKKGRPLTIPSWAHLELGVGSPTRANLPLAITYVIVILVVDGLLLGILWLSISRARPLWLAVIAGIVYVAMWGLTNAVGYRNIARGYELWTRTVDGLEKSVVRPLLDRRERHVNTVGYLLLPRPNDTIKALFIPGSALLGWLASGTLGTTSFSFVKILCFWLVFDLIFYQARYLWNDSRDRFIDRQHLDPQRRERCPIWQTESPDEYLRLMFLSFGVRHLIAFVAIGILLLQGDWPLVAGLAVAVVLVWVYSPLYERERDKTSVTPPHGLKGWIPLWLLVSCGYGLRVMLGLFLGLGKLLPVATPAAAVGGAALGIAFVTMTWALEATNFLGGEGEQLKPHLRPLLKAALAKGGQGGNAHPGNVKLVLPWPRRPRAIPRAKAGDAAASSCAQAGLMLDGALVTTATRVLKTSPWRPAPWDIAAFVSIMALTLVGCLLSTRPGDSPAAILPVALPLAALICWLTIRVTPGIGLGLCLATAAILAVMDWAVVGGLPSLRLIILPLGFFLPAAVYLAFRGLCYEDIRPNIFLQVRNAVVVPAALAFVWFIKPRTGRKPTAIERDSQ